MVQWRNETKKLMIAIILLIVIVVAFILVGKLSSKENSTKNSNGEVDKVQEVKNSQYNNPIIPTGFKKVETKEASWELDNEIPKGWNNGLVIEDEIGNQFVWVPAKEITVYELQSTLKELMDQESEVEKEQIQKYEGFYIGRYEAGVSEELKNNKENISANTNDIPGKPVSMKDRIPWNFISLKNAKINAQSMYDNTTVKSDLITTRQ